MSRVVRAPTGSDLNCKGWLQEAAYRMLQNNLDPEVAAYPEDLIVYGGRGRAARNWQSFDAIFKSHSCARASFTGTLEFYANRIIFVDSHKGNISAIVLEHRTY